MDQYKNYILAGLINAGLDMEGNPQWVGTEEQWELLTRFEEVDSAAKPLEEAIDLEIQKLKKHGL